MKEGIHPKYEQTTIRCACGDQRTGKTSGGYKGKYIITSLDLDGQAGDDAKYSINLENCGKVEKVSTGLTEGGE